MKVAFLIDGSHISTSTNCDSNHYEETEVHTDKTAESDKPNAGHSSNLIAGTILRVLDQLNRCATESVADATPRSDPPPCSWGWKYTATSSDSAGATGKRQFCPVHKQSFHAFCDDLSYHATSDIHSHAAGDSANPPNKISQGKKIIVKL